MVLLAAIVFGMCVPSYPGQTDLPALAGRWTSTVQAAPGERPAINPLFEVEAAGERVVIHFGGEKERYPATVFQDEKGQQTLMFKTPDTRGGTRTFIIRPIAAGQVRLEVFVERQQRGKAANFCFSEVFRKSK